MHYVYRNTDHNPKIWCWLLCLDICDVKKNLEIKQKCTFKSILIILVLIKRKFNKTFKKIKLLKSMRFQEYFTIYVCMYTPPVCVSKIWQHILNFVYIDVTMIKIIKENKFPHYKNLNIFYFVAQIPSPAPQNHFCEIYHTFQTKHIRSTSESPSGSQPSVLNLLAL